VYPLGKTALDAALRIVYILTSQTSCKQGIPVPRAVKKPQRRATAANIKGLTLAGPGWQLQAAKARFSEVFRLARTEGPQLITRQGKDGVVMMPVEQFDRLMNRSRQPKSLVQFFRESPLVGLELDLERDKDIGRDIEL
jgi:antitoxin Phd